MARRPQSTWAFVASACALVLVGSRAEAEPGDAAAMKMRDDAIYTDYLAMNYGGAESQLEAALAQCSPTTCSAATRARLLCDLGIVDFMLQRADEGRARFAAALKEDPNLALDADLSTPELQREFAAVKSGATAVASGSPPAAPPPTVAGDMRHTPVTAQAILTPVPIYVQLPEGLSAARVYVRYKAPGAAGWKTADMSRVGAGYGVEIPCAEVGDSIGDLKYFVQAVDASGDLLASNGRLVQPYTVRIVQHLDGDPPHLPDRAPPSACAAATDCPPSFPGCDSDTEGSPEPPPRRPYQRNWLSVAFQTDALLMPSAANACSGGTGYTCFASSGSYYSDTPLAGADDQVNGGLTLATSRFLVGYDRAIGENVTLGVRLGYALGGGPQRPTASSFMPIHVEARGAFWFGDDPLARDGLRFFVLAAGGMAQVDASVPVGVYASTQAYQSQQSQNYQAWKKTGLAFGALGGGAMYAITAATGVLVEAKAMEMFPTPATGFNLQLAYLVGL